MEQLPAGEANLSAVKRIESWLETSLLAGHTIGVETVLSTPKYRRLVELAKRTGHEFQLIYVLLDSAERNVERVKLRVRKGGHDVPPVKIVERYSRSLAQMPWFLEQAETSLLYDNSGTSPRIVGRKRDCELVLDPAAPRALLKALGVER